MIARAMRGIGGFGFYLLVTVINQEAKYLLLGVGRSVSQLFFLIWSGAPCHGLHHLRIVG